MYYMYVYVYIYIYIHICTYDFGSGLVPPGSSTPFGHPVSTLFHTCHILLPSEIDLGLRLAVFAGSGGKHIFHRIGLKGRIWQLCI